jgi:hypothetical protein
MKLENVLKVGKVVLLNRGARGEKGNNWSVRNTGKQYARSGYPLSAKWQNSGKFKRVGVSTCLSIDNHTKYSTGLERMPGTLALPTQLQCNV